MPRPEPRETVRFTLDLPYSLHRRLRMKAIERGVPASAVTRELLERWTQGNDPHADALREAYAAGVRAERQRVLAAVTGAPSAATNGLPRQRPQM